jgi:isopenicillin N synthase-like dioxygenase
MNVYSLLLLLLFYPIFSFGFATITTTTMATMHHNNQDATPSDDDDDVVTVPLIHIDTTTKKKIIDDDGDDNDNDNDERTSRSSTTTVITNLPSRKTSRLLVSALKDSGFALVQSNLLTSELQSKTLQAASQFLASSPTTTSSNNDDNKNNNSAQEDKEEDKAVVVGVISHPTDPKVYAMLDSVDQCNYVDSSNNNNDNKIKEYVDVLRLIKTDILRHIAVGLLSSKDDDDETDDENDNNENNIDIDFFAKLHDEHNDTLRLITYYPTHSITTGNRCKEHSDYGTITLLSTDGISGLELYHNGRWKPVPFIEGTLVINVGSLLSGWTKGILRATLHRVAGPGSINSDSSKEDLFEATKHPRTSIAFFADPNYNVSESLTATAATAAATTSSSNNNNKNEMNDDKEKDPLTTALEGMSVSEYIRWRSGGTDDDIKRSGVSFTKNETDVLLLNKK